MVPDAGHAAKSAVSALPAQLVAGKPETVTVTARDAAGNLTVGGDRVEVHLDSAAEGTDSRVKGLMSTPAAVAAAAACWDKLWSFYMLPRPWAPLVP